MTSFQVLCSRNYQESSKSLPTNNITPSPSADRSNEFQYLQSMEQLQQNFINGSTRFYCRYRLIDGYAQMRAGHLLRFVEKDVGGADCGADCGFVQYVPQGGQA